MWHDAGAYASSGAGQPEIIVPHMMSAYVLPALRIDAEVLFTNSTPSGFIRGGGRPLGNFAIERMMDRLAAELRLDPAELRRRNLIQPGQMPYDTGYPEGKRTVVYDGGDYPKLLDMALDGIDYGSVRASQANGERGDGRLLGLGLACCVESSGFGRGEPARVRLEKDGRARLWIGSTPQGQGHRTIAAQMLADRLGWPLERIEVTAADTRGMPSAELTAGSRSAMHVGNATALAAAAARQRLLESAAEVLEADPADLVLEDGHVSVRGVPGRAIGVTEAIPEEGIEVLEKWDTRSSTAYSSGCHAALVAIDPETGSVELLRYAIAHDTGRPVNAMLVEGQMHGGLAHGLGYALFEEAVYLPDGTFVTPSFLDYTIASAPELASPLELMPLVTPTEANPEGIKGAGESGTIPVPAAVANAVEDAIRQADPQAAVDAIPITPLRLYQMLNRRG
jgi:carbon-monoxide dehydrogenase large subunit